MGFQGREGRKRLSKFKGEDKGMLTGPPKVVNSLSPHIHPVSVSSQFLGEHCHTISGYILPYFFNVTVVAAGDLLCQRQPGTFLGERWVARKAEQKEEQKCPVLLLL